MKTESEEGVNWEQKLDAIQCLGEAALRMREPGNWYVDQSVDIAGGGFLKSFCGDGETPEGAVEHHWEQMVNLDDGYVIEARPQGVVKHFLWAGYTWKEVPAP